MSHDQGIKISFTDSRGYVFIDNHGEVWWVNSTTDARESLADRKSLCGWGPFETDEDDLLRDACSWHDHAYVNQKFFEDRGWDRESIDNHFLDLMMVIIAKYPERKEELTERAQYYYNIVRSVGWIPYYLHKI